MKKIMFDDRFGLTDAVLDGRKTTTRRFAEKVLVEDENCNLHWNGRFEKPRYKIGEVVAVAQSYKDAFVEYDELTDEWLCDSAGWNNKMFVRAYNMPHKIRITDARVERLQDISEEDARREGVSFDPVFGYYLLRKKGLFKTARAAFAALIDKISGKGVWKANPYVFVYTFELVE